MKDFGRILVLIDDLATLAQVEPHFSDLPEYWKVHVTQTAENALCLLEQVPFELIFVDLKSGPLASVQFLHQVWAKHPGVIRFLLTESMPADLMVERFCSPEVLEDHIKRRKADKGTLLHSATISGHE